MEKTDERKKLGYFGENLAARYLESRGYKILFRNYQKPWGEIDIIAEKEGIIVFCEVKTSNSITNGNKESDDAFNPEVRVNPKKMSHIVRTADIFINGSKQYQGKEWRVDIVSILLNKLDKKASIKHFKNV